MVGFAELIVILELHQQGMTVSAIARGRLAGACSTTTLKGRRLLRAAVANHSRDGAGRGCRDRCGARRLSGDLNPSERQLPECGFGDGELGSLAHRDTRITPACGTPWLMSEPVPRQARCSPCRP